MAQKKDMEQKGPLSIGLKMLEDLRVVRHNEFRFISSEFGFVRSFNRMEAKYIARSNMLTNPVQLTRQEEIFQRFISLVNTYSKKERNVNFYADKLCLTSRYLNTVVRQASQQTVMEWINQSIMLEAKILLKHGNQLVYQISDELNFPNPSFFCKFFKRMTGMTPHEYQKT